MSLKYILVVLGGTVQHPDRLLERLTRWFGFPESIVAADSGYDRALALGLNPDCLLGDFDSTEKLEEANARTRIRFPSVKDQTDSEIALDYAMKQARDRGIDTIVVIGYAGTRHDHMLANLQLLVRCARKMRHWSSGKLVFLDETNRIECFTASESPYSVAPLSTYFSVIPETRTAVVSIEHAKYPLERATLKRGLTVGISNEFQSRQDACVRIHRGECLLIWSDDRPQVSK